MKRILLVLALFAAAAALILWLRAGGRQPSAFLGYVEGDVLYIGPVEGERIASLFVETGQHVEMGAPLFRMDTSLLRRQRAEAAARIGQMEAQLANLQAALNRPQQIAVLEAAVARAQSALDLSRSDYQRQKALYEHGHTPKATLDRAEMALKRDEASLAEAKRQIEAARLTGRSQEIEAAEAALRQARAARDQLDLRINRQDVKAPAAGVVQDIFFREGETVNAGQAVIALLPPGNRKARFYVPQARLDAVRLGDFVQVRCDGCPAGILGRVFYVSGREEYTPPVIFSDEERQKLVFKVEARLEGAGRELPLGLPISVRLIEKAAK